MRRKPRLPISEMLARDEQIKSMRLANTTLDAIGKEFGMSRARVHQILVRMGVIDPKLIQRRPRRKPMVMHKRHGAKLRSIEEFVRRAIANGVKSREQLIQMVGPKREDQVLDAYAVLRDLGQVGRLR